MLCTPACAQCGYPSASLRSYNWGLKAKRRKTTCVGVHRSGLGAGADVPLLPASLYFLARLASPSGSARTLAPQRYRPHAPPQGRLAPLQERLPRGHDRDQEDQGRCVRVEGGADAPSLSLSARTVASLQKAGTRSANAKAGGARGTCGRAIAIAAATARDDPSEDVRRVRDYACAAAFSRCVVVVASWASCRVDSGSGRGRSEETRWVVFWDCVVATCTNECRGRP